MFQQEHVPVKATTLKEDIPTSKVIVTESVVEQENTTAAHEIEQVKFACTCAIVCRYGCEIQYCIEFTVWALLL